MSRHPMPGISVIVCCYNSAIRIPKTLRALAMQRLDASLKWEVLVIDNASTDRTCETAEMEWHESGNPTQLRVLKESRPGLRYAREKGIASASFDMLVFCDDDNRLETEYLQGMFNIFSANPDVGACGGKGIADFEGIRPSWFDRYQECFAVGPQAEKNGDAASLYGAGMAIRISTLETLRQSGFTPVLSGRMCGLLSSGEDIELTYAVRLAGYRLHYDGRYSFHHYMPEQRMTRTYLKNLFAAFGTDGPVRELYFARLNPAGGRQLVKYRRLHFLLAYARLVKYAIIPPKPGGRHLYITWSFAYLRELRSMRKNYRGLVMGINRIGQRATAPENKASFTIGSESFVTSLNQN